MNCVGAIIEHPIHGFLLQFRDEGAPSCPHTWTTFGGAVEDGETPEEALWRELAEEIEFERSMALSCQFVQRNVLANGTVIQYVYHLCTEADVDELVLHEGGNMAFFDANELFALPFAFNIEQVYRDHLAGRRDALILS
ncbi:NUDIX domain-containing protein [Chloroflexi bacterium TSY]|nr:NUDIX domain-containing protein [Chloroflexi bacterium TSY]